MMKYSTKGKILIKSIVATLSIKKVPEQEIIQAVYDQTNKTIARKTLYNIKQQIKKES
jgi:hypothetical protein